MSWFRRGFAKQTSRATRTAPLSVRPSVAAAPSGRGSRAVSQPAGVVKARFLALLSDEVRPFLKARGFAKSGSTFYRRRAPLYDVINFQGSDVNGVGTLHRFYVNIGVGSLEVDGVAPGHGDRPKLQDCLAERRWEGFVDGAPHRVEILSDSDLHELADETRHWLGEVLTVLDAIDSTAALVDLAISGNLLQQMQKVCSYLASIEDIDRLRRYVGTLRDRFGADPRWGIFNRQITAAAGLSADELRGAGLLDPC